MMFEYDLPVHFRWIVSFIPRSDPWIEHTKASNNVFFLSRDEIRLNSSLRVTGQGNIILVRVQLTAKMDVLFG